MPPYLVHSTDAIVSVPHLHSVKSYPKKMQTNQVWGLDAQCNDSYWVYKLDRKNVLIYGANLASFYSDSLQSIFKSLKSILKALLHNELVNSCLKHFCA